MSRFVTNKAFLTMIIAAIGTMAAWIAQPASAAELVRVTSSFELKYAGAVIRQVAKVFDGGLGKGAAEKLTKEINTLPSDRARSWDFTVRYRGADYPLQVRALLDDLGMLDLDFATDPVVAPAVRSAVDGYLNARGL